MGGAGEVRIPEAQVLGDLTLPCAAAGLVVFAHGSGSSRFSGRNRQVARVLHELGIGTLLLDLLRPEEEGDRAKVFDIELLSGRLVMATRWIGDQPDLAALPLGYFGASTGAGAALMAAAGIPGRVTAVVSRGGRPDLAGRQLSRVTAPTLLIVGGADQVVLDLNRAALSELPGEAELTVIPGATHLFEEPGALEEVSRLAGEWFGRHFSAGPAETTDSASPKH